MFIFDPNNPKTLEYTETKNGKLRGFKRSGIYTFLGVKYGQCKRWQTATPVTPWKGIKNAVQFGNRAWPIGMGVSDGDVPTFTPWDSCGVAHEAYNYDEDCLNLNIWSPSIDPLAKKPVMVWIHGGGYSSGSSMEMQGHYGENLAKFGDVVVVTVNHRLNILGFFDVSKCGEQYKNSGNCGISDLVLALQWVRDNIEAFGGDPKNVLIFGQSGGGGKVRTIMQTPAADGLYHKAIIMSGTGFPADKGHGIDEGSAFSEAVLEALYKEFNTQDIRDLEALPVEHLLSAAMRIGVEVSKKLDAGPMSWRPVANDWYPGDADVVGFNAYSKHIPVMVGSTISEGPLMRIFNKHSYTEEQQMDILREAFPDQDVERLAALFRNAWPEKCLTDAIEITGNLNFRPSQIHYCDYRTEDCDGPTYSYIFAHDFPQDGGRGAWHCADIPVVFHNSAYYPENFKNGLLDGLEDAISGAWVAFAHTGDPNNQYLNVHWPKYLPGDCATMIFDQKCEVKCDPDRELIEYRNQMRLAISDKYTQFTQLIN